MEATVLQIEANVPGVEKLARRAIILVNGEKSKIELPLPENQDVHAGDKITLLEESMQLEEKLA